MEKFDPFEGGSEDRAKQAIDSAIRGLRQQLVKLEPKVRAGDEQAMSEAQRITEVLRRIEAK